MIQDFILAFISILFCFSLIPTIIKIYKTKITKNFSWISLILTAFGLLIISLTFFSMKCYFACITNFLTSICWFILLFFKIIWRNK